MQGIKFSTFLAFCALLCSSTSQKLNAMDLEIDQNWRNNPTVTQNRFIVGYLEQREKFEQTLGNRNFTSAEKERLLTELKAYFLQFNRTLTGAQRAKIMSIAGENYLAAEQEYFENAYARIHGGWGNWFDLAGPARDAAQPAAQAVPVAAVRPGNGHLNVRGALPADVAPVRPGNGNIHIRGQIPADVAPVRPGTGALRVPGAAQAVVDLPAPTRPGNGGLNIPAPAAQEVDAGPGILGRVAGAAGAFFGGLGAFFGMGGPRTVRFAAPAGSARAQATRF